MALCKDIPTYIDTVYKQGFLTGVPRRSTAFGETLWWNVGPPVRQSAVHSTSSMYAADGQVLSTSVKVLEATLQFAAMAKEHQRIIRDSIAKAKNTPSKAPASVVTAPSPASVALCAFASFKGPPPISAGGLEAATEAIPGAQVRVKSIPAVPEKGQGYTVTLPPKGPPIGTHRAIPLPNVTAKAHKAAFLPKSSIVNQEIPGNPMPAFQMTVGQRRMNELLVIARGLDLDRQEWKELHRSAERATGELQVVHVSDVYQLSDVYHTKNLTRMASFNELIGRAFTDQTTNMSDPHTQRFHALQQQLGRKIQEAVQDLHAHVTQMAEKLYGEEITDPLTSEKVQTLIRRLANPELHQIATVQMPLIDASSSTPTQWWEGNFAQLEEMIRNSETVVQQIPRTAQGMYEIYAMITGQLTQAQNLHRAAVSQSHQIQAETMILTLQQRVDSYLANLRTEIMAGLYEGDLTQMDPQLGRHLLSTSTTWDQQQELQRLILPTPTDPSPVQDDFQVVLSPLATRILNMYWEYRQNNMSRQDALQRLMNAAHGDEVAALMEVTSYLDQADQV